MPVYKGDNYLSEAISSILSQTFSDFEFIIICDDPTDETRYTLDKYQQKDFRIRVYYQERQGLVNSLNKGFSLALGEYIVRMDADDISLPTRLEKQVEFMDENSDVGISGTWVKTIGNGNGNVWEYPCDHETIKCELLFYSPLAHPSVILRKDTFCKNNLHYEQDETYAEDYGLWVRSVSIIKCANIPEVLLYYRIHGSTANVEKQKKVANKIRVSQIRQLGINPTKNEIDIINFIYHSEFKSNIDLESIKLWFEKLHNANFETKLYPEPAFSNILSTYWFYTFRSFPNLDLKSWCLFNKSKLSEGINLSYKQKVKFTFKALTGSVRKLSS